MDVTGSPGRIAMEYDLYNNRNRTVRFNRRTDRPEDVAYQDLNRRISPQVHDQRSASSRYAR